MSKYRILVVGAGFWGQEWAKTILESPDLELVGVVTKEMPTCAMKPPRNWNWTGNYSLKTISRLSNRQKLIL